MILLLAAAQASPRFPITALTAFDGGPGYQYLGYGMAPLGDLDGDGYGEAALGGIARYGEPGITLIEGAASGASSTVDPRLDEADDRLCCWSPTSGDLDGDGDLDLVVGLISDLSPGTSSSAYILRAEGGAIEDRPSQELVDPYPASKRSTFGEDLALVGDLDGDGTADLLVGVSTYAQMDPGVALVYFGSPAGFASDPDLTILGETEHPSFGDGAAGVGDMDGDGVVDFLVGNPVPYDIAESGVAWLYHGGRDPELLEKLTVSGVSEEFGSILAAGGDINADGYKDAILSDPRSCVREDQQSHVYVFYGSVAPDDDDHTTHDCPDTLCATYGGSVAGAGDVDGDGFDDMLVGNVQENHALLYPGSADGPVDADAFSIAPTASTGTYTDYMASAGDLDGDGWPELLIGDSFQDVAQGRVEVWGRPRDVPEDTGEVDTGEVDTGEPEDTAVEDSPPPEETGAADTATPADSGVKEVPETSGEPGGCGCTTGAGGSGVGLILVGVLLLRRRSGG